MAKPVVHGGRRLLLVTEQYFKDLMQRQRLTESPQMKQTMELEDMLEQIRANKKLSPDEKANLYAKVTAEFLSSRGRTKEITGKTDTITKKGSDPPQIAVPQAIVPVVQPAAIPAAPPAGPPQAPPPGPPQPVPPPAPPVPQPAAALGVQPAAQPLPIGPPPPKAPAGVQQPAAGTAPAKQTKKAAPAKKEQNDEPVPGSSKAGVSSSSNSATDTTTNEDDNEKENDEDEPGQGSSLEPSRYSVPEIQKHFAQQSKIAGKIANAVLEVIKKSPVLSFDTKTGELSHWKTNVPNSDIVNLIHLLTIKSSTKTTKTPGVQELLEAMVRYKIEPELIKNTTIQSELYKRLGYPSAQRAKTGLTPGKGGHEWNLKLVKSWKRY